MERKRLLYISCHETLEYDELRIFSELGFDCFSIGYWMDPHNPKTHMRPALPNIEQKPDLIKWFKYMYPDYMEPGCTYGSGKVLINQAFADQFDVMVVANYIDNLSHNIHLMKDKPVIYRSIAAPSHEQEHLVGVTYVRKRPFYVIRMSEAELKLAPHIKGHGVIRQCVDKEVFKGWTGQDREIFTVVKGMKTRPDCNFQLYQYITQDYPRILAGNGNEGIEYAKLDLTTDQMAAEIARCRVSYVQPRWGACISYSFAESMMAGAPVVTVGKKNMGPVWEGEDIIKNGVNGFISDTPDEVRGFISNLMDDDSLANRISQQGRKTALKLFDYEVIKQQWKEFLEREKIL